MACQNLLKVVSKNPYPGRGIVLGRSHDGQHAWVAYFIMGRSANSRNRIFAEKNGMVMTEAADPSAMQDPSLVIYNALRRHGSDLVVTNGDQTDTIFSCLERDITFEEALRTRTFEPDAPNYTPRISGLLRLGLNGFSYKMSILKSADGDPSSVQRHFFEYPQPSLGQGHFIHTYAGDGNPLPSFAGEPVPVSFDGETLKEWGDGLWDALNEQNTISLLVRSVNLDGSEQTKLYNKYTKE